ncbi:hypothetical protein WR25_06352 [Diploscapter pachys]|uniref:Uncharacterized protein n=1 Tax=Diploscapter pachys TaxID=2018661 RepID=A0A2A2KM96_9BILA|nr:hypothetical protein WR25_06352 [Diploscapter pachys]
MVEFLSDNTGHGPASCSAHHLRRYDCVYSFNDDSHHDLCDTRLHLVYDDHINTNDNNHINNYNNYNDINYYYYNRSLLRKLSSTS